MAAPGVGSTAPRVGVVVVSHSRALAEAAVALALEMVADDPPPVAVAAGTEDGGTGTDASAVLAAVQEVGGPAGVLVVMDLGSAVLSAELALELAGDLGFEVRLSPCPFVEGVVAALVQAAGGATLAEVALEAAGAAGQKAAHLSPEQSGGPGGSHPGDAGDPSDPGDGGPGDEDGAAAHRPAFHPEVTVEVEVVNPHGLHARPAAAIVALARRHDVELRLHDLTTGRGPASARSLVAVQTLGAVRGDLLRIEASGPDAAAAVKELERQVRAGFGETDDPAADRPAPPQPAPPQPAPSRPVPQERDPVRAPEAGGLSGVPGAPGQGVGPVWHADELAPLPAHAAGSPQDEQRRLEAALADTAVDVQAAAAAAGHEHRGIFEAHLMLLADEALTDVALAAVAAGADAATAWQSAVDEVATTFDRLPEQYLAARAADVRAVGAQVRRVLQGVSATLAPRPGVLVTTDLTPDQARSLDPDVVVAVVTERGSATSHAAILARAAGLPLVVGAGTAVMDVAEGTVMAVDGSTGRLVVGPDEALLTRWADAAGRRRSEQDRARADAHRQARTQDDVLVHVAANAAGVEDARAAAHNGADGIGLLRTELVFHGREEPPTEDEQVQAYLAAGQALDGGMLVVRTLDVGGDKPVAYAQQPVEANPFLGLRGLRLSLARPDLFATQLRAVVRTALEVPLGVMFPMVSTVAELHAARAALTTAAGDVGVPDGLPPGLQVGVMVEVPAAALNARHLAPHVDFMSVGTNDLTQYVMAAERGNAAVAGLADGLDPAVLHLLAAVCHAAGDRVRVAVCGELAADPVATGVLVGLGVRELSVAPRAVPEVKVRVRALDTASAVALAQRCLQLGSAQQVRELLSATTPAERG